MSPSFSPEMSHFKSPLPQQAEYTYYTRIQQSDLVPTISSLFNWPIPRNNIGPLLKSLLSLWNPRDQPAVLGKNILQIAQLVNATHPEIFSADAQFAEENTVGLAWTRCRAAWNSNAEDTIDICYEVHHTCLPLT
jgi:ethanolamine phosphate transferase 2 subunit G